MKRDASTKQVAEALGVTASTVQKYARDGLIPFVETPGKHRRYDIDEVRDALTVTSMLTPLERPKHGIGPGAPVIMSSGMAADQARRAVRGEAAERAAVEPALEHLLSHSTSRIFATA